MSVRGEFQRILGDTTASLRVHGEPHLADALEQEASGAGGELEARARAVLEAIEAVPDTDLRATLGHLEAICSAIVGRRAAGP